MFVQSFDTFSSSYMDFEDFIRDFIKSHFSHVCEFRRICLSLSRISRRAIAESNMGTMKQYGDQGKKCPRAGRRRVAEAITSEITTGRVIARLNGTITGLIWSLIAPATALRNDAPLLRKRAHWEGSSRSGRHRYTETDSLSGH